MTSINPLALQPFGTFSVSVLTCNCLLGSSASAVAKFPAPQPFQPPCWQSKQQIKHRQSATNWSRLRLNHDSSQLGAEVKHKCETAHQTMQGFKLIKHAHHGNRKSAARPLPEDSCGLPSTTQNQRTWRTHKPPGRGCVPTCLAPQCMSSPFKAGRWGLHAGKSLFYLHLLAMTIQYYPYICETHSGNTHKEN